MNKRNATTFAISTASALSAFAFFKNSQRLHLYPNMRNYVTTSIALGPLVCRFWSAKVLGTTDDNCITLSEIICLSNIFIGPLIYAINQMRPEERNNSTFCQWCFAAFLFVGSATFIKMIQEEWKCRKTQQ